MPPEMKIDSRAFDTFLQTAVDGIAVPVTTSVITKDADVERYWPILEAGSTPGQKPWPSAKTKTLYGAGGRVFSKQAPQGFVSPYSALFVGYLTSALAAGNPLPTQAELRSMVNSAAAKVLAMLKTTIPVDTGKARDSLDTREE